MNAVKYKVSKCGHNPSTYLTPTEAIAEAERAAEPSRDTVTIHSVHADPSACRFARIR